MCLSCVCTCNVTRCRGLLFQICLISGVTCITYHIANYSLTYVLKADRSIEGNEARIDVSHSVIHSRSCTLCISSFAAWVLLLKLPFSDLNFQQCAALFASSIYPITSLSSWHILFFILLRKLKFSKWKNRLSMSHSAFGSLKWVRRK